MFKNPVQYRNVRNGQVRNRRIRLYPRGVAVLRSMMEGQRLTWNEGKSRRLAHTRTRGGYRVEGGEANRYGVIYQRTLDTLLRLETLRQAPGYMMSYVITDAGRSLVRKYALYAEIERERCASRPTAAAPAGPA